MADVSEDSKYPVREEESERHIFFRVPAGIAEHHSLVSRTLVLFRFADDSAVDVRALGMQFDDYPAAVGIEAECRIVITDAAYGAADHCFYVYLDGGGSVNLSGHHYQSGGAECLAGDLGFRVLAKEFIKYCV